jgi:hypothetical protein
MPKLNGTDARKPEGRLAGRARPTAGTSTSHEGRRITLTCALFRSVAEGETGHAFGHLTSSPKSATRGVAAGASEDNLKSAVAGRDLRTYRDVPGLRAPLDEGLEEIASGSRRSPAEQSHARWFQAALSRSADLNNAGIGDLSSRIASRGTHVRS